MQLSLQERAKRNDTGVAKRLDKGRLRRAFCLVPFAESADIFIDEELARSRQDGCVAKDAEARFYERLLNSVRQGDFESAKRLFVVNGTMFRLNRRTEVLLPELEEDLVRGYLSKSWAAGKVASAWCRQHGFTVPARWRSIQSKPLKKVTRGRPPIPQEIAKQFSVREASGLGKHKHIVEARELIKWFKKTFPSRAAESPTEKSLAQKISAKWRAKKAQ